MSFCFIAFLMNVNFSMQNQALASEVSKFSDEKTMLRAEYLRDISANNLRDQADNLSMVFASSDQVQTVKKRSAIKKSKRGKYFKKLNRKLETISQVVSGY